MISELDGIIQGQLPKEGPGAAVAVVRNGEPVHVKGYGLANVEWNIPIEPDTVFRLASVTKQFTSTAIMMLAEEGKLSVNDPLEKFLPDYPTSGHHITIYQLLNHTSGIRSYTSEPSFGKTMRNDSTPEEMAAEFSKLPFDFKPGTRHLYNNSAYFLLGIIIEKLSGMTYAEFMQKRIFEPLGMKQSCYLSDEPIVPKRASGYDLTPDGLRNTAFLSMTQPYAAGSLGSTVNDMILWDKALRENTLISSETLAAMYARAHLEDGSSVGYGYGWGIDDYHNHHAIHHGGNINGFTTFICRFVDDGLSIIVLSNVSGFNISKMVASITRQVFGIADVQREPVSLTAEQLKKVAGTYLHDSGFPLMVTEENGQLSIAFGQMITLKPLSESQFYNAEEPETLFTFTDEQNGQFTQMEMNAPLSSPVKGQRPASE